MISPPLVSFFGEPATPVMSGSEAQKLATKEERMREHYRRAAATSLWVLNLDEEEMASLLQSPVPEQPTPSQQPLKKEPVDRRQRRVTIVERIARSIRPCAPRPADRSLSPTPLPGTRLDAEAPPEPRPPARSPRPPTPALARRVVTVMDGRDQWVGTAADLIAEMEPFVVGLPKGPAALSRGLTSPKVTRALEHAGVSVSRGYRGSERILRLCRR